MILILGVIVAALVFEFINGFHDTANSIATVVSTKVMTPRQAVAMAAICDLGGALWGTSVAMTIGTGLVDTQAVTLVSIFCALLGAIIWGLLTWWVGLPSSSSHALIGGLCGATLAAANNNWGVLKWSVTDPVTHKVSGLFPKVIYPMVISPLFGLIVGFIFMGILLVLLRKWNPHNVYRVFGKLQVVSATFMGFSHGTNDAQKTMGIIALTLFIATKSGKFDHLPESFSFLKTTQFDVVLWVKILCAITMACGTACGGWRIIKTLGHKMVKLQPIHGFAAETTAASVIQVASAIGIPLSTTHVISSSIMGVGSTKRLNAVKWSIVERMIMAWILTLPITGFMGYSFYRVSLYLNLQ